MNNFTAEQYRSAAEIVKAENESMLDDLADALEDKADQLDHFDNYVTELARLSWNLRNEPMVAVGYRLITKLLSDGWKAPDGMINGR